MKCGIYREDTVARNNSRAGVLAVVALFIATTPAVYAKRPESQPAIMAGTQINVRLKDKLRSDAAKPGDQFRGRLETPITADGLVVYPKGTEVSGYVVRAHASADVADPGVLELDLISIGNGANVAAVTAKTLVLSGETHKKSADAKLVLASTRSKRDSLVESDAILTWVAVQPGSREDWSKNPPKDVRRGAGTPFRIVSHVPPEEPKAAADRPSYSFSDRDRRALRKCLAASTPSKTPLSAATQKQIRKDSTLPAGLQKRLQPLPSACTRQLSPVPSKWARVMLSGRVMVLDPGARIVDVFEF